MPRFNIGDLVVRNSIEDEETDAEDIDEGQVGYIVDYQPSGSTHDQPYLVEFNRENGQGHICWWIGGDFIDLVKAAVPVNKQQKVIDKIKYLNDRYNNRKSRVVPNTVGVGITEQLRASAIGAFPEGVITRATPTRFSPLTAAEIAHVAHELARLRRAGTGIS
jgi:hypothetical protein